MNPDLMPKPPPAMAHLPKDAKGFVVPFFVAWVDGKPDHRITDGAKLKRCVNENLCWLCGGVLARYVTYTIGPMCSVNHISAEPPSHRECAEFAVRACPFLSRPKAQRRETNVPDDVQLPAGEMIRRNPAVTLLWTTRSRLKPIRAPRPDGGIGFLFDIGEPAQVHFFREGRAATRAEVLESFDTGKCALHDMAVREGPAAIAAFERGMASALALIPAEAA